MRIPRSEYDTIARRYAGDATTAGETMEELGRAYGVSRERIRQILAAHGACSRPHGLRPGTTMLTEAQIGEALRRRDAGESVTALAASFGVSIAVVTRQLRRHKRTTANLTTINRPGQPWRCTRCGRSETDGAAFVTLPPRHGRQSKRQSRCNDCAALASRQWYRANADAANERARAKRSERHRATDATALPLAGT